ncbi:MAG: DUF3540 domain-containing protein [Planctomycetes bacterium]|mgnify:CR=1 FL=1|nr:DUF3540 domain-containing protein [Planctomycetota bacterium]
MIQTDAATKLGPAVVRSLEDGRITAEFEGEQVSAVNAIAFPWTPNKGDVVLLIAQEDAHYVIGVLQTQGDFTMTFPANVNLRAPKGAINLHSGEGIDMHAPDVKVTGGKITLLAKTMTEKLGNAFRWVGDLVQVKAGRSRTLVDGASYERCERRVIKAKKDVRVNGNRIHLG